MLFSSVVFLFYFLPVVLAVYYALKFSKNLKNIFLLISSLLFYAWGEIKFVFVMILSIIVNFTFGILIDKYRKDKRISKFILSLMCIYNLGILFIFKYLSFVIRNINELQNHQFYIPKIPLPIGISFFTFQAISYVIDVYKNEEIVQRNILYVGLYIAFFPQLIAGPIVRYSTIAEQIRNRKENLKQFSVGCCRFITGLAKKVLISNNMAVIADRIFKMSEDSGIAVTLAWLGSIAYTFQIFYDFSGYSDMAIGLGLMFGFKFDENFNFPYISKSISEFWRRWHISLGRWFRDYVYIPLGGSRVENKDKLIRNLLLVWVLTGIWHGAEWNFFMWGIFNFLLIVFEKMIDFEELKIKSWLKHIYALFFINLGWVLFRSVNLRESGKYISYMFGLGGNEFWSNYTYMFIREYIVFIMAAIILSMPICRKCNKFIIDGAVMHRTMNNVYPVFIIGLFLVCLCYLIKGTYNPFIYFNF